MKVRIHVVVWIAVIMTVWAGNLRADEDSYAAGMTNKGARGLVNLATGWFEVPMQIVKGYNDGVACIDAPAGSRSLGAFLGIFRGVSQAVGRTAWGAVNLVTFWAVNPTDNRDLLLLQDANYVWEKGEKKAFLCPKFSDGAKRMGDRLERGAGDLFGCFLEVPGQIKKSDRASGQWWPGIPKGLYYMVSRLVNGASDIALILVPGPVDNLMVPYDEVYPWDAWEGKYYSNIE